MIDIHRVQRKNKFYSLKKMKMKKEKNKLNCLKKFLKSNKKI